MSAFGGKADIVRSPDHTFEVHCKFARVDDPPSFGRWSL
jgi:hypothetical protein